jgi:hypothetical protein
MATVLAGRSKALRECNDVVGRSHRFYRLPQRSVLDTDDRNRPVRTPDSCLSDDVEQTRSAPPIRPEMLRINRRTAINDPTANASKRRPSLRARS